MLQIGLSRNPLAQAAVVVASTTIAALVHFGFVLPMVGTPAPLLVFVLAILVSASYGGFWPGVASTLLSAAIVLWTSDTRITETNVAELARITMLTLGGLLASALAAALHRARRDAEGEKRSLQSEITNRRLAEIKLAASDAEFRELAESIPDFIFTAGTDGRIVFANRRWLDFTASDPDRPIADWLARVHPAETERVGQAWGLSLATDSTFESRCRLRGADDQYRWFFVRARPVTQPASGTRWFGVIADIDAQMKAESALRDREEQLRLALESTGLGIFEIEFWTRRTTWSDRCRDMWGFGQGEVLTMAKIRSAIFPPDRRQAFRAINRSRDVGGSGEFSFDVRVARRDGALRWIAVRGRSFFVDTADGERAIRAIGTMLDITERLVGEEELREADRRKDEFLAVLAHELRNPLAPIASALEMMASRPREPEVIAYARDVLHRQVAHMVRLIDDLLDVGRIAAGKLALRRSRTELRTIIDSAVETVRPLIASNRHELRIDVQSPHLVLDCDAARISQVLANLLNNSAKYTDPGGVIELGARVEDRHLRLTVRDNGTGIAAESLPKIFDMFAQAGVAPAEGHSGLGVGLPLARELVALHGGTIEAASAGRGLGTEVTVKLPLKGEDMHEAAAPKSDELATGRSARKVLVVDDNRDAAESLAALLRLFGHQVEVGYDGAQAIALSEQFRPDILLLDVGMPKMDGHEAARRVRAEPWGKSMHIVALSGFGQEQDRARSIQAGCNAHLIKPVSPDDLKMVIELSAR